MSPQKSRCPLTGHHTKSGEKVICSANGSLLTTDRSLDRVWNGYLEWKWLSPGRLEGHLCTYTRGESCLQHLQSRSCKDLAVTSMRAPIGPSFIGCTGESIVNGSMWQQYAWKVTGSGTLCTGASLEPSEHDEHPLCAACPLIPGSKILSCVCRRH